jgi:hypothetical protein
MAERMKEADELIAVLVSSAKTIKIRNNKQFFILYSSLI